MFSEDTLRFLEELEQNNNQDWFAENKQRYEDHVRSPALDYIRLVDERIDELSPHFRAVTKKVGGSLMRVYRDVRFSKDKTPYKANIGIQFRHELGKDVHVPGFYVHIEPEQAFLGAGIWHPDSPTLGKIRDSIVEKPDDWIAARDDAEFSTSFKLSGNSLRTYPRGYDREHPLIDDLKRKDFIAIHEFDVELISDTDFTDFTLSQFEKTRKFMGFICNALDLRY